MRVDKEMLGGLAERYDKARAGAGLLEAKRRELGKEIIDACFNAKKKRVEVHGWVVGYDVQENIELDEKALRPLLEEMGEWRAVTTRSVDQEKLARLLERADPKRYEQIVACMKKTKTRKPHVRKAK